MHLLLNPNGEIGRSQWWAGEAASLVAGLMGLTFMSGASIHQAGAVISLAGFGAFLLAIWVHLAVSAKRFRDHGFSPWWALIWFLPWFGWLAQIVMCGIMPSEARRNRSKWAHYHPPESAAAPVFAPRLPAADPNRPRLAGDRLTTPGGRR